MKLSWQYDSFATLMDRCCWFDIFVLLNISLILMTISRFGMIRAVEYFSDVELKYKFYDME